MGDDDVVVIVIFTTTFLFRGSGRRRRGCPPPNRKGVEKPTVFTPSSLFVHLATTGKTTTFPVRQTSVRPTSVRVSARVIFARQPSRHVRVCTGMPVVLPLWRRNSLPKSINHGRTRDRPERVSCPRVWIARANVSHAHV